MRTNSSRTGTGLVRRGHIFPLPAAPVATHGTTAVLGLLVLGSAQLGNAGPTVVALTPPGFTRLAIHWPGPIRRGKFFPTPPRRSRVREEGDAANNTGAIQFTLGPKALVGDTVYLVAANDFYTPTQLLTPTGTAVGGSWTLQHTFDGGLNDNHAKVWEGVVTNATGTIVTNWGTAAPDEERYAAYFVVANGAFDSAASTDADTTAVSHVAPSATPAVGAIDDVLICVWGTDSTGNVTYSGIPSQMTVYTERDIAPFMSTVAASEQLTSASATGTRTATASVARNWWALSFLVKTPSLSPSAVPAVAPSRLGGRLPRLARRGRIFPVAPPAAVVSTPPAFVGAQIRARRPVGASGRLPRGKFLVAPPVPGAFASPQVGARRAVGATVRLPRGRFFPASPPVAVVPAQPAFVGPQIGARHPVAPMARLPRGRFLLTPSAVGVFIGPQIGARHPVAPTARLTRGRFLPLPQAAPPTTMGRLNSRPARPFISRRGQIFFVPVPVVVVAQTGPLVPRAMRTNPLRVGTGTVRRGRVFAAPVTPTVAPTSLIRPAIHWPGVARRGRIFPGSVPQVVTPPTGPVIPKTVRLAIHWPTTVRRGRVFPLPMPAPGVPPTQARRAIQWRVAPRRGQLFPVPVPAAIITPVTPAIPKTVRLAIHWPTLIRRGRVFAVSTPVGAQPSTQIRRAGQWRAGIRRGQIFPVPVPAVVVAPTGPVVPKTVRLTIHWPGPIRRGKIFFIPSSSQAAPTTTPVAPRMIQQHQQTRVLTRRGKITPVVTGQPGWVPSPVRPSSPVSARGARPGTMPRGRRWITPTAPTGPIAPMRPARRILAVRPPRGRFLAMPPTVVIPPPAYVPRIMRARGRFWFFARRGRVQFTRLTGAAGFPAEFISASSGVGMISADSGLTMVTTATTGSAEFTSADWGVTFVDGDTGTQFRGAP